MSTNTLYRASSSAMGTAVMAAILIMGATASVYAQASDDDFHFEGEISPGSTVIIRNVNGAVRVQRASGDRVLVDARKRWEKGDPSQVRIEATRVGRGGADLLVCAFWNPDATCDADGYRSRSGGRNRAGDVSVQFTVQLPDGVLLDLNTVNGELRITGATARVAARTVNGLIDATSLGGPVHAETVNGSIVARMGSTGGDDLAYRTVNGSITLEVPRTLHADVDLKTVNGRIDSDFPLTVQGRINPRQLRASIGGGGQRITASTVNGSVRLVESR